MRLSDITTEVYGCTKSVFMIIHSLSPQIEWNPKSNTYLRIDGDQFKCSSLFTKELTNNHLHCLYPEISFSFCAILMKCSSPKTFLPNRSSFLFFLRFLYLSKSLKIIPKHTCFYGYTDQKSTSSSIRTYIKFRSLVEDQTTLKA